MVQMADKLRQSSDDLTHFARTYVITNNQTYKQQYYETLDIRNGKMPRPLMYESIYWDLNKDIRDKRHPNDKPVALKTLFNNLPYTRDELELLTLSEKNSNDLVNLEIEAFNAMIGKYKDDKNQYTITKKPDQNYAIKLLHSEEYYQAKHKIMNPIDNFMIMLNKRTQEQTDAINEKVKITYILFVISIFILVVANIFIYRFLSKQKAKKLEKEVTLSKTLQTLSMDLEKSNRKLKSINQDLGQ
ncbi:MAG: methyl-accepting chemotaxis protein, partial [Epsilonproteobacteria bacterium]